MKKETLLKKLKQMNVELLEINDNLAYFDLNNKKYEVFIDSQNICDFAYCIDYNEVTQEQNRRYFESFSKVVKHSQK